jgi:kinesin family protein 1
MILAREHKEKDQTAVPSPISFHILGENSDVMCEDWAFAQIELLREQGFDVQKHMETKVSALEVKMRKEVDEAREQFEQEKREYESQIQELRKKVEGPPEEDHEEDSNETLTERQAVLARMTLNKWRTHQCTSLRDDLLSSAVLLKEANAISVELKKQVMFQFVLLSNTQYTSLPPGLIEGADIDAEEEKFTMTSIQCDDPSLDDKNSLRRTVVAVEVTDIKHGATHYWSLAKLRQRIFDMRDLYKQTVELESQAQSSVAGIPGSDPFYDQPLSKYQLVGRSFVFLTNLLHNISLMHQLSMVNEKGEVKGSLKVVIEPLTAGLGIGPSDCKELIFDAEDSSTEEFRERQASGGSNSLPDLVQGIQPSDHDQDQCSSEQSSVSGSREIVTVGIRLSFRVIIHQAWGLPSECDDVYCQFKFVSGSSGVFSTRCMKRTYSTQPIGFFHVQNLTLTTTSAALEYFRSLPIVFEMFAHYNRHQDDSQIDPNSLCKAGISSQAQPVTSSPLPVTVRSPPSRSAVYCHFDLLVWYEIPELASSGEYIPAAVHHGDHLPCGGVFLLQQGIQRRLAVTLVTESSDDLKWRRVHEVVIGRIRNTLHCTSDVEANSTVQSLNILNPKLNKDPCDARTFFQFEAAWDSSLHNSVLLNRVTPSNEHVFVTVSLYIEAERLSHPVCISKDICLTIRGRDSKRPTAPWSLKNLIFGGGYEKTMECNRVTALCDLTLKRVLDTTSPSHRQLQQLRDTSSVYVRGEENLRGWKPRGTSLLLDHEVELERVYHIHEVERIRQFLQLRDKLANPEHEESVDPTEKRFCPRSASLTNLLPLSRGSIPTSHSANDLLDIQSENTSISDIRQATEVAASAVVENERRDKGDCDVSSVNCDSSERQQDLARKVIKLLRKPDQRGRSASTLSECSPGSSSPRFGQHRPVCVGEVHDIQPGMQDVKKGWLYFLEQHDSGWKKRWVVVKRPYMFVYNSDRDPVQCLTVWSIYG